MCFLCLKFRCDGAPLFPCSHLSPGGYTPFLWMWPRSRAECGDCPCGYMLLSSLPVLRGQYDGWVRLHYRIRFSYVGVGVAFQPVRNSWNCDSVAHFIEYFPQYRIS